MKHTFKIGDCVHVNSIVTFNCYTDHNYEDHYEKLYKKIQTNFDAIIVGATIRYTGKMEIISEHKFFKLKPEKHYIVYQIRRGMTNKIQEAFEEDLIKINNIKKFPWRYNKTNETIKKHMSNYMKDYMKNVPRDSKGRWLKEVINEVN